jgi:cytoskeletal protein CcmA (bactofilin family)
MLGSKDKGSHKGSFSSSNSTTLISRDTEVIGDIKFGGNLDIEGTVRGNIIAQSGKDAVIRVVDKGLVEGNIHAPSVIINGTIHGDVYSTKHLELAAKARVQGNVQYTLVEMAIGAEVNGGLKHCSDAPAPEAAIRPQGKPAEAKLAAAPVAAQAAPMKS